MTKLGSRAFYYLSKVESITFAEGSALTEVGNYAFSNCSALTAVVLPDSVTKIGTRAFERCTKLTDVYVPDGVSYIQKEAFYKDASVTLNVAKGSYAHKYAEQYSVAYTLRDASVLYNGTCGENLTWELYSDGLLKINGTGAMNDYAATGTPWYAYRHQIKSIEVGAGVTKLGSRAFYYLSKVEKVAFAENSALTEVGSYAFSNSSALTDIILPDSVTSIGTRAFEYSYALSSVYVPDGVSYIQKEAFWKDTSVTLSVASGSYAEQWAIDNGVAYTVRDSAGPANVEESAAVQDVISDTETPSEVMPAESANSEEAGETVQPKEALTSESAQASVDVSESTQEETVVEETEPLVQSCGDTLTWAVENGVLTISGTGNITAYSSDAPAPWANMEITEIVIDKEVTSIGSYAFYGLEKLEKVTFAEECELTEIGDYAFAGCKALKEIVLPEKIEKIGEAVFYGAEALESVTLPASIQQIGERLTVSEEPNEAPLVGIFEGCDKVVLTVTVGSYAEQWANENSMNVEAANVSASVAAGTLDTEQ